MLFVYFVLAALLIKLSLFGLGLFSIVIAIFALILTRIMPLSNAVLVTRFKRTYKIALFGHLAVYLLFIAKLLLIDGLEDVPSFIAAHLISHHIVSVILATSLLVITLRSYNVWKEQRAA